MCNDMSKTSMNIQRHKTTSTWKAFLQNMGKRLEASVCFNSSKTMFKTLYRAFRKQQKKLAD